MSQEVDPTANPVASSPTEQVRTALAAIMALRARADEAVQGAEEASRKANSESGYAYNAKQQAEEHARTIAQVKGTVEADLNWLTATKNNAAEIAEALAALKRQAESDARSTADIRGTTDSDVSAIRNAREKSESIVSSLGGVREEAERTAKRTGADALAATQARATVEASASAVQAQQAQVGEAVAKVQADANVVATRTSEVQLLAATMAEAVASANASQAQVMKYELELARLSKECTDLRAKVESLLPGATSAGLASAFRLQKERFDKPQRNWLVVFVLAIVMLLVAGSVSVWYANQDHFSWDSIQRHVVGRLPMAIPLLWLALFAGRNYMLTLRLQEDYSFKEAISTAFEGYRREMAGIQASEGQAIPLLTLCDNVLRTLGQRPGRLYEGKHDDITPLSPLSRLVGEMRRLVSWKLPEGPQL